MLTKLTNEKKVNWDEHLSIVLLSYCIMYKVVTWDTLYQLVYGFAFVDVNKIFSTS
jgi:hypothetical protein